METQAGFPTGETLSTFSALHLLRNYNHLFLPTGNNMVQVYHSYPCGPSIGDSPPETFSLPSTLPFPPFPPTLHPYSRYPLHPPPGLKPRQALLSGATACRRRPRGEKKPIPEEQKDDRYYERRKRNNQAAKKSRDARKLREDQVALRATLLEHENAILRAQVVTLREETEALRRAVVSQKKSFSGPAGKEGGEENAVEFERKWEPNYEIRSHFRKIVD